FVSRRRSISALEARFSAVIWSSVSFRLVFSRPTNFSSESNASSNGNVTWTEADSNVAGDGEALGDGVTGIGLTLMAFELLGAGTKPANNPRTAVRINNRCIVWLLSVVMEQQVFQQSACVLRGFLHDLRTWKVLTRSIL